MTSQLGRAFRVCFLIVTLIDSTSACARTSPGGPTCTSKSGSAGLTIDSGTTLQDANVNQQPNAQCTSCASGTRQFYTATTASTPQDAIGDAKVSEGVQCPDSSTFCTCNAAGVCCTPGSTAPDTVLFIPICQGGTCFQDVVVQGDPGSSLTCTDGSRFTVGATNSNAALGSSSYFEADSVSCSGCSRIRNDQCQLPIRNL